MESAASCRAASLSACCLSFCEVGIITTMSAGPSAWRSWLVMWCTYSGTGNDAVERLGACRGASQWSAM